MFYKYVYVYYALMLACFAVSFFYLNNQRVKWLMALLAASIATETIVEIIGKTEDRFFIAYHFFIIAEYALTTLILRTAVLQPRLRQLMLFTIFLFIILSFIISFSFYHFQHYPSINANIESALIIIWCLIVFFSIQPQENITIFQQSIFWINLAFFIYFTATLPYDSMFNFLVQKKSLAARYIFNYINSFANYILYILLTIGIIFTRNERRITSRSY